MKDKLKIAALSAAVALGAQGCTKPTTEAQQQVVEKSELIISDMKDEIKENGGSCDVYGSEYSAQHKLGGAIGKISVSNEEISYKALGGDNKVTPSNDATVSAMTVTESGDKIVPMKNFAQNFQGKMNCD